MASEWGQLGGIGGGLGGGLGGGGVGGFPQREFSSDKFPQREFSSEKFLQKQKEDLEVTWREGSSSAIYPSLSSTSHLPPSPTPSPSLPSADPLPPPASNEWGKEREERGKEGGEERGIESMSMVGSIDKGREVNEKKKYSGQFFFYFFYFLSFI